MLHVPTIKPIDEAAIVAAAAASGQVVVVEEQSVLGGLGGAVAEVLSSRYPVPVKRLGIQDVFGESGPNEALLDKYRLSARAVAEDVETWLRDQSGPAAYPPGRGWDAMRTDASFHRRQADPGQLGPGRPGL